MTRDEKIALMERARDGDQAVTCSDLHTTAPKPYDAWMSWAERKTKTHQQLRCPLCGRFSVWVKNEEATP